jgi:hypothetical protein
VKTGPAFSGTGSFRTVTENPSLRQTAGKAFFNPYEQKGEKRLFRF